MNRDPCNDLELLSEKIAKVVAMFYGKVSCGVISGSTTEKILKEYGECLMDDAKSKVKALVRRYFGGYIPSNCDLDHDNFTDLMNGLQRCLETNKCLTCNPTNCPTAFDNYYDTKKCEACGTSACPVPGSNLYMILMIIFIILAAILGVILIVMLFMWPKKDAGMSTTDTSAGTGEEYF